MLERFLDLTAFRQSLIAGNLANIDTPGYRTRDIDFRGELRRAVAEQTSELTTPFVRPVPGLIERPDGNDVSIDRESLLLAQLQLQFRVGVQLLRAEMQQLRIAITEGR
jgi:flagellar basal-body rod protein FlgB